MWGSKKRNSIKARKGWKCEHCGKTVTNTDSKLHHNTPRIKDGKDRFDNVKLLCLKCEKKEHDEHPERYLIPYMEYVKKVENGFVKTKKILPQPVRDMDTGKDRMAPVEIPD